MRIISARLGWSGFSAAAVSLIRAAFAVVHRRPQVAARIWRRIRYASAAAIRVSARCRIHVRMVRWASAEASRVSKPASPASPSANAASWPRSRPASQLLVAVAAGRHPQRMPGIRLTSFPARAEQLAGQRVCELPADDQHVHQVQRLEHDRGLLRFHRQSDDARTAAFAATKRAAPEIVMLSAEPALVYLLDLPGVWLVQAVACYPDSADVSHREPEDVRVFSFGGLPIPGVCILAGALARRDVANTSEYHRDVLDEPARPCKDPPVALGIARHLPGDAVPVVLVHRLGD